MKKPNDKPLVQRYFIAQSSVLHHLYLASEVENHMPDTGYNRESILIGWLDKHLPQTVSARSGGKIIDSHHHESNQVDVVIYENSMPQLGGNEKTYYFAEGVVAAIEVKSKLNSKELKKAFRNLATVKQCKKEMGAGIFRNGQPKKNPVTGLFAYDTSYKSHQAFQKAIDGCLQQYGSAIDFICVNGKVFFIYFENGETVVDHEGNKTSLTKGYNYVSNSPEVAWQMLFMITQESRSAISHGFNMLAYFMKGKDVSK